MKVRRGDEVMVIAGRDLGKRGRVERVMTREDKVIVAGLNMVTKHMRPRPGVRQAGRIQQEAPLQVSNVMLVCSSCDKPVRTRAHYLEDNRKVRVCQRCQETIDWTRVERG